MTELRDCIFITGDERIPAKFHGIYQKAWTVGESLMIGGPSAGQIAKPIAVIEYDGRLHEVNVRSIDFNVEVPHEATND